MSETIQINSNEDIIFDHSSKEDLQKNIDIYPHLKKNLLEQNDNCKEILSDEIYYCLDCKLSTCEKCSLKDHKNHNLIKKTDIYNYYPSFFTEVEETISNANKKLLEKDSYINLVNEQAKELHSKIEETKNLKIKEIGKNFDEIKRNLRQLDINTKTAKKEFENFYKNNQNFLNINKNNDNDNSIFLIYYEIISLLKDKNKNIIQKISQNDEDFINYKNSFETQKQKIIEDLNEFIGLNEPKMDNDDPYWDLKFRIKTYNEHFDKLKKNIYEIMKNNGNDNNLKEIVNLLESKNRKGIQFIFNQEYFNTFSTNIKKRINKTRKNSNEEEGHSVDSIKKDLFNKKIYTKSFDKENKKIHTAEKKIINKYNIKKKPVFIRKKIYMDTSFKSNTNTTSFNNYNPCYTTVSKDSIKTGSNGSFIYNKKNKFNFMTYNNSKVFKNNYSNAYMMKNLGIKSPKDITLDDKTKKKFFTYSIIDLYNKLFTFKPRKSFDNNIRIFADYKQKNNNMKEYIKPIIGTNEILIYNPSLDKAIKKKINLNKNIHSYDKFPGGCRHLFIEDKLYICGGVDPLNCPINTTLVYEIKTNNINRIDNMIKPHSYHSMEFLENYDCFVVIGGENNRYVELFDIFTQKWTKLPDLNVPRANINIYFDEFTSELYALFGSYGNCFDKKNIYSEVIEVLEFKDISSGWCKIDYYKGSSFDIRQENVTILPFTRTKLLIYGGKGKDNEKLFGIYLIDKMELIKADKDFIDKIKYEQKRFTSINNV